MNRKDKRKLDSSPRTQENSKENAGVIRTFVKIKNSSKPIEITEIIRPQAQTLITQASLLPNSATLMRQQSSQDQDAAVAYANSLGEFIQESQPDEPSSQPLGQLELEILASTPTKQVIAIILPILSLLYHCYIIVVPLLNRCCTIVKSLLYHCCVIV